MARHSFIQMSKLPNVKGRISYITSHARQENLYATYRTADNAFWNNLARESRQEFQRSGAEGKCIEARELIIALPEVYTQYEPQQVLEDFTDEFRRRYGVECVSALHHNKRKTNYHIHLIFSERKLLPEPDVKIATRSVFFDETGKRVRTKKEITGEDGQIRKGCTIIKKGEVYESHLFTVKDDRFKREPFLREVKEDYTNLINLHIENPEQHLKVFDKNSVYLPTKKIGKNNPKAEEIAADNATRQEWNRTADMALVSGIEEAKILEIKQTEIHDKVSQSIKSEGWLPNLFRRIVNKAKDILQNLIREYGIPPKPTLDIDMTEFCTMATPSAHFLWTRSLCPMSCVNSRKTGHTCSSFSKSSMVVIPCPTLLTGETKSAFITRDRSLPFAYCQRAIPFLPSRRFRKSGLVLAKSPMVLMQ